MHACIICYESIMPNQKRSQSLQLYGLLGLTYTYNLHCLTLSSFKIYKLRIVRYFTKIGSNLQSWFNFCISPSKWYFNALCYETNYGVVDHTLNCCAARWLNGLYNFQLLEHGHGYILN
jgi:hypothetical protein